MLCDSDYADKLIFVELFNTTTLSERSEITIPLKMKHIA